MKKITGLCFFYFLTSSCFSQLFHAFLFCKTNDRSNQQSNIVNFGNMQNQLEQLASILQLRYVEHCATSLTFTCDNINEIIKSSKIGPNDIVFLYFSTHGEKTRLDKDSFPQLDIPNQWPSSYQLHLSLKRKSPKMLITAIEACSNYHEIDAQQSFLFKSQSASDPPPITDLSMLQRKNIGKLFSYDCDLIITAGNPGAITYGTNIGSPFTNSLIKAINVISYMSDESKVDWETLFEQAKVFTYEMNDGAYYPVWRICAGDSTLVPIHNVSRPPVERNVKFVIIPKRNLRPVNSHTENLTIENKSGFGIDSVRYILDRTFLQPIVTIRSPLKNYFLSTAMNTEIPIKAVIYFSDGWIEEKYKRIDFSKKVSY